MIRNDSNDSSEEDSVLPQKSGLGGVDSPSPDGEVGITIRDQPVGSGRFAYCILVSLAKDRRSQTG